MTWFLKSVHVPALLACLTVAAPVCAQVPPTGWTLVPKERVALADATNEAMAPGENHAVLASMAGDWTFEITFWTKPDEPPAKASGSAIYNGTMGGRFLQGEHRGVVLGRDFHGIGVTGYDNLARQFVSVWWDNMSTTILSLAGAFDPATRTFTYGGEMADLLRPGTKVGLRHVLRLESPDRHVAAWFETREGREEKAMEITYTRVPVKQPRRQRD